MRSDLETEVKVFYSAQHCLRRHHRECAISVEDENSISGVGNSMHGDIDILEFLVCIGTNSLFNSVMWVVAGNWLET